MQKTTTTTPRSRTKSAAATPEKPVRAAKPQRRAAPVPEPVDAAPDEELDLDEELQAAPADPSEYPEKVKFILEVLDDMKAIDVETYYVVGKTILADFFILCTGSSSTQTSAIADALRFKCKEKGWRLGAMEGHDNPSWKILDYEDVVVHVFLKETREFYRLEEIWGEGRRVASPDDVEPVIEPLPLRPRRGAGATAALRKRRAEKK